MVRQWTGSSDSRYVTANYDTRFKFFQLLERARKQGEKLSKIYAGAGSSMRLPQPLSLPVRRSTQIFVYLADAPDVLDETGEASYYMNGLSFSTEYLPLANPTTSEIHSDDPFRIKSTKKMY